MAETRVRAVTAGAETRGSEAPQLNSSRPGEEELVLALEAVAGFSHMDDPERES